MNFLVVYLLWRLPAITLGGLLTLYSMHQSYHHFHDFGAPLAALSAALMLFWVELAVRAKKYTHASLLLILGIAAAGISSVNVLQRNLEQQEAKLHETRSANLSSQTAKLKFDRSEAAYEEDRKAASKECASGEGDKCKALTKRETKAKADVEVARVAYKTAGVEKEANPTALTMSLVFGIDPVVYQKLQPAALPVWLEIAAPVVLAFGFAPFSSATPTKRKRKAKRKSALGKVGRLLVNLKRKLPFKKRRTYSRKHKNLTAARARKKLGLVVNN